MNQLRTHAIVLTRVEYGEADRIVTFLTDGQGKITLIAKGVRKVRSKLSGGIELFSVSEIVYIPGRSSVGTLVSARVVKHHVTITSSIDRTMFGYELLKIAHKITEEDAENGFFAVLQQSITALDDPTVPLQYIEAWMGAQLLSETGHMPNLITDVDDQPLEQGKRYDFDFEHVAFRRPPEGQGAFDTDQIKFLRILFGRSTLVATRKIGCSAELAGSLAQLITTLRQFYLGM